MVRIDCPQPAVSPLPRRSDEGGVILVTVILILSALLILALPLAFMCKHGEQRAFNSLETAQARAYARLALNHTKHRLRMGIYENEYYSKYPRPTASPTATPEYIVDKQPYDTPFFDGPAELYFDRAFDWDTLLGEGALRNPQGIALGVEVEDEQGKLNVNSLTPEILLGLFMVTKSIEPSSLSASDRDALQEFYERVLTPMALLRIADPAVYAPVSSVDELAAVYDIDGDSLYALTESDFDTLKRFLTADSWRQRPWGFQSTGFAVGTTSFGEEWVGGDVVLQVTDTCVYRVEAVDKDGNVLMTLYAIPDVSSSAMSITVEDVPREATKVMASAEEFHPVNLNTVSREVLAALIMSAYDSDSPRWTTLEAIDLATRMRPEVRALGLSDNGNGYDLALDPNSDYKLVPENMVWPFSVGGIYCLGKRTGDKLAISQEDGERLQLFAFPLAVSPVFQPEAYRAQMYLLALATNYGLGSAIEPLDQMLTRAVDGDSRALLTSVGYDCYTIRVSVSVNTEAGLQTASWTVEETVELGLSEMLKEPVSIDTLADLQDSLSSTSAGGFPRKFRPYRKHSSGGAIARQLPPNAITVMETYPPRQVLEWYDSSSRQGEYLMRQWLPHPTILPGGSRFVSHSMVRSDFYQGSAVVHVTEGPMISENVGAISNHWTGGFGNVSAEMWIRVPDFGAVKSSTALPLYSLDKSQDPPYNLDGGVRVMRKDETPSPYLPGVRVARLYIKDSRLSLAVYDATGEWGRIDYALTEQNFPPDTWMHVLFHFGGNHREQMVLMVDFRPVPVTYTASGEQGWVFGGMQTSYSQDGSTVFSSYLSMARGNRTLTSPLGPEDTEMQVSDTTDFPLFGWLRIGDEVVSYSAKTNTSFTGLTRGIGGTAAATHHTDSKVYQALVVNPGGPFTNAPRKGDRVTLISDSSVGAVEQFTLDMDAVVDDSGINANTLLVLPRDHAWTDTATGKMSKVVAFCRVSGSCGFHTGDRSTLDRYKVAFLSDGSGTPFPGDCKELYHRYSTVPLEWLRSALGEGEDSRGFPVWWGNLDDGLSPCPARIGEEIIAQVPAKGENSLHLARGMLGTQRSDHPKGSWVLHLTSLDCYSPPIDIGDADSSLRVNAWTVPSGVYRLDDELIYMQVVGTEVVGKDTYSNYLLVRGYMGSTPAAHDVYTSIIRVPPPNPIVYELDGPAELQKSFVQFIRRSSSTRYLGLTWNTLNPDPFVRCHAWLSTKWRDDFPMLNSPDLFHFADGMTDFSITRPDGSFPMSDMCLIRFTAEYLQGAWLPNDPTRHSWKRAPTLDRIDLWLEQPDTVYRHVEGPR